MTLEDGDLHPEPGPAHHGEALVADPGPVQHEDGALHPDPGPAHHGEALVADSGLVQQEEPRRGRPCGRSGWQPEEKKKKNVLVRQPSTTSSEKACFRLLVLNVQLHQYY